MCNLGEVVLNVGAIHCNRNTNQSKQEPRAETNQTPEMAMEVFDLDYNLRAIIEENGEVKTPDGKIVAFVNDDGSVGDLFVCSLFFKLTS